MLPPAPRIKTHLRGNHRDTLIELEGTHVSSGSALTVITRESRESEMRWMKFISMEQYVISNKMFIFTA